CVHSPHGLLRLAQATDAVADEDTDARSFDFVHVELCVLNSLVRGAMANWLNLAMRRASRRSMCSSGSKFFISPAMWIGYAEWSNDVRISMPDLPARQLAQNSLTEFPIGVIAPMPVTTTRVPFLSFLPLRPAMLTSVLN